MTPLHYKSAAFGVAAAFVLAVFQVFNTQICPQVLEKLAANWQNLLGAGVIAAYAYFKQQPPTKPPSAPQAA